jgi:hypothetical protein
VDAHFSLVTAQPEVKHYVWVRFNPDAFDVNGVRKLVRPTIRLNKLLEFINTHKPQRPMEIAYMYYTTLNNKPAVLDSDEFPKELREMSFAVPV